ncbi:LysM peptidoglycan-binding domain-containing protein [Zhaonella formicivorans]|uniref:LysM peptidoglycan-binding domain-containing protein n=1 Tax=Zhaonella formicivorans TaxID=2528593 RepID=UPI0010DCCD0E|nr:LysM peptidoglycan-binding domain-containing protein [Zhaonella formicivorans]
MRLRGLKHTIFTAALASSLFFSSGALPAQAQPAIQKYTVAAGDTLWLLSQRYGTTVEELKKLNSLTGTDLTPGQQLFLPVSLEAESISYTVQKGDTLFLIANRTGTGIESIKKASNLSSDALYPGQILRIPVAPSAYTAYVVKSGDSLWSIAREKQASVEMLKSINKLSDDNILAGQILLLPGASAAFPPEQEENAVDNTAENTAAVTLYRVKTGDTLAQIAAWFGTTVEAIYQTNQLHSDTLMPGQPLYIPKGRTAVKVSGPIGVKKEQYGEFLPWEWARWIYNPGAVATVIDWQTGKKFNIRHLGGSSHADSEPLTAADTAVMASLYPQGWSWSTRPVLLQLGSRLLAASIAGMPHSVESIKDNNFNGHFDLYFYNSRSHNTNQIQPEHQANVLAAAGLEAREANESAAQISARYDK